MEPTVCSACGGSGEDVDGLECPECEGWGSLDITDEAPDDDPADEDDD